MAHYRLYFMNQRSGHIDRAEIIDAVDDLSAVKVARNQGASQPLELWCGGRKVYRIESPMESLFDRLRASARRENHAGA